MVSFRNSSFSRNQTSSIIRKKTPPLHSTSTQPSAIEKINKSSFSYSTRSHKHRDQKPTKPIDELSLKKFEMKTTENVHMVDSNDLNAAGQDRNLALNELEKHGQN